MIVKKINIIFCGFGFGGIICFDFKFFDIYKSVCMQSVQFNQYMRKYVNLSCCVGERYFDFECLKEYVFINDIYGSL